VLGVFVLINVKKSFGFCKSEIYPSFIKYDELMRDFEINLYNEEVEYD